MSLLGIFLLCFAAALVIGVAGVLMKSPGVQNPDTEISEEEISAPPPGEDLPPES